MSNIRQVVSPPPTPTGPRFVQKSENIKEVQASLKQVQIDFLMDNGKLLTIKCDQFNLDSNRNETTLTPFFIGRTHFWYHKFGNMVIFRSGILYSLCSPGNQDYQKLTNF